MSLFDELAADAARIVAEAGKPVEWDGRTLQALVAEPLLGEQLGVGGFTDTGDFIVKLLRDDLGENLPEVGDLLTFAGAAFRILRVSHRPPHPFVVLTVGARDE